MSEQVNRALATSHWRTDRLNPTAGGAATVVPLLSGGFAAVYSIGGEDIFTLFDDNFNPIGGETSINDTDQSAPQAAALTDGQFVVAWLDGGGNINASIYNADGSLSSGPLTLATPLDPSVGVSQPKIVGNAFGGFTAIWQDNSNANLFFQSYDSTGVTVGAPITVAPPTVAPGDTGSINDFRMAELGDGTIVVAAQVDIDGVEQIMYSVDGGALQLLAGGDPNFEFRNPRITPLAGGGYVITYDFVNPSGVGTDSPEANWTTGGVVVTTSTGNQHDFAIGTTVATDASGSFGVDPSVITPLADGGFVGVYQDADENSWAQIFGPNRAQVGSAWEFGVGGTQPVVASQTDATFMVAWSTGTQIMGEVYDNQGNLLQGPFDMSGPPSALPVIDPALNALPGGGYMLAYEIDLRDGGDHQVTIQEFDNDGNVVGQMMTSAGAMIGGQFTIQTTMGADTPAGPLALSALPDGGFLVTYDPGDSSLAEQRFDQNGNALGGPVLVGSTGQSNAATTVLSDGSLLLVSNNTSGAGGLLNARDFAIPVDTADADCFAAGTKIATTRGPVSVECIQPGDRVCTVLGGDTAEVIWTGYRTIDCIRHAKPERVWPIVVLAHAFGRGMPATDLMLSPEHAVYVDEVLIPIRLLINGRTVRQVPVARISYHHIELAQHDVVLANGMPAESYLDTGNRSQFTNGGNVIALHADFSTRAWETTACARLALTGAKVTAVRKRLAADAARRRRPVREVFGYGGDWSETGRGAPDRNGPRGPGPRGTGGGPGGGNGRGAGPQRTGPGRAG